MQTSLKDNHWKETIANWWHIKRLVARLGSVRDDEREQAILEFVSHGRPIFPTLYRALRGSIAIACGAAVTLSRMGSDVGVQTVLIRCYDEEWLTRSVQEAHLSELVALRRLNQRSVGEAMEAALSTATFERDFQQCLNRLTLALSALRMLHIYDSESPWIWWERALRFGHHSLPRLRGNPFAGLAYQLTDNIRAAALRGMLVQYPSDCLSALLSAFQHQDLSVMRTALGGLHKLRDKRALPCLQAVAFAPNHPLALEARRAVEQIVGSRADSLLLLRGAHADANVYRDDALLRPASPAPVEKTDLLLRPTKSG